MSILAKFRRIWFGGTSDDNQSFMEPVSEAPYKVEPPVQEKVLYVSPYRGRVELAEVYNHCAKYTRSHTHFMEWYRGNTSWTKPDDLFTEAFERGEAKITGYVFGDVWTMHPDLRQMFADAARRAGFTAEYVVHGSDGPEADTFSLIVRPMQPR